MFPPGLPAMIYGPRSPLGCHRGVGGMLTVIEAAQSELPRQWGCAVPTAQGCQAVLRVTLQGSPC